ncbi:hypothetical protein Aduo_003571 [Ancylostoma duodenale]
MSFLLALAATANTADKKGPGKQTCFPGHDGSDEKGCSLRYKMTGDRCEGTVKFQTSAEATDTFVREAKKAGLVRCSRHLCLIEKGPLRETVFMTTKKFGPKFGGDVFLYCLDNVLRNSYTFINEESKRLNKGEEVPVKKLEKIEWPLPGATEEPEEMTSQPGMSENLYTTLKQSRIQAEKNEKAKAEKPTKTKGAPGFFQGQIGSYKATFFVLGQVFLVMLAMQIYLLIYLNRMRSNYVLITRSAVEQDQTSMEDEEKRTKGSKKPAKRTELPDDLSGSAKKLVYSLEGSIPQELFSAKILRKMS